MEMSDNLKRLRKEHDLTQEELAGRLGCSPQAVSRWERGEGYPEVTMIPVLANVFGVTTDELFGMDEKRKAERIAEFQQRIIENGRRQIEFTNREDYARQQEERADARDVIALEAMRDFAGDYKHEVGYASLLSDKYRDIKIAAYERALDRSTDDSYRAMIRSNFANLLNQTGDTKRAIELIEALPYASASRTYLQIHFAQSQGREGVKNVQSAIREAYQIMQQAIGTLRFLHNDDGSLYYDVKGRVRLIEKDVALYLALEDGESAGSRVNVIGRYMEIARQAAGEGLYDTALAYIEKSADAAVEYAANPDDPEYTGVLRTESENPGMPSYSLGMPAHEYILFDLDTNPGDPEYERAQIYFGAYDAIRDDARYIAAVERVKKLAETV